jgi:hypothetical protein
MRRPGDTEKGQLFEVLDHPDVAALRAEAIEEDPFTVWRPYWIVDADVFVGELKNALRGFRFRDSSSGSGRGADR